MDFKVFLSEEALSDLERIIYRTNNTDQSLEIVRFWHGTRGFPHIPVGG